MTFESYELWIAVAVTLVVLVPVGLYTGSVYNELTSRWERLHALLASARLMKSRRRTVGRAVRQHVRQSARHVENTTRHAAWGKRGGGAFKVNADSFPQQQNVALSGRGIEADLQSCGLETDAQLALRREAAEYNSRLRSFPCCLVARWFGFRPWNTHGPNRRPGGHWRPRHLWRRRRRP
jgi:hypothetical protein